MAATARHARADAAALASLRAQVDAGVPMDNTIWNKLVGFGRNSKHKLPRDAPTRDLSLIARDTEVQTNMTHEHLIVYIDGEDAGFGSPGRNAVSVCAEGNWARHNLTKIQRAKDAGAAGAGRAVGSISMYFRLGPCVEKGCLPALSALAVLVRHRVLYYTFDLFYTGLNKLWAPMMYIDAAARELGIEAATFTKSHKVHPLVVLDIDGTCRLGAWICKGCKHAWGKKADEARERRNSAKEKAAAAAAAPAAPAAAAAAAPTPAGPAGAPGAAE